MGSRVHPFVSGGVQQLATGIAFAFPAFLDGRHEVWNTSDQVRIALLLDVWRRDMPMDIALLSRAILLGTQAVIRMGGMSYGG